ncbi:hypothetical protein, partial [Anaerotalea alkaliphila]|uniref:hypothetical protein n=1 Tax=Anaerotalea alkaliphila TaxID=2662126 RepID=UPI001BA6136A
HIFKSSYYFFVLNQKNMATGKTKGLKNDVPCLAIAPAIWYNGGERMRTWGQTPSAHRKPPQK